MASCPSCRTELAPFEFRPGFTVELCPRCKALVLDAHELGPLVERELVFEIPPPGPATSLRCPRCADAQLTLLAIQGAPGAGVWSCAVCAVHWLEAGAVDVLRRLPRPRPPARSEKASMPSATSELELEPVAPGSVVVAPSRRFEIPDFLPDFAVPPPAPEAFSRSRFDAGRENLIAVPAALAIAWLFCSTTVGNFFARLGGMPFHELGHAVSSWLTSRFAVPLPFFTIWANEQSFFVGLVVAGLLAAFTFASYRERRRFAFGLGLALLLVQIVLSWIVPSRASLMIQILGGALGEIFFGALLLVAFHFPLPDRLRWDFWRWFALVPGSIVYVEAFQLWLDASRDTGLLPWGSAVGSEADGDMNRLVRDFGWTAEGLASFYLGASCVALLLLAVAWTHTWRVVARSHA